MVWMQETRINGGGYRIRVQTMHLLPLAEKRTAEKMPCPFYTSPHPFHLNYESNPIQSTPIITT